MSKNRSGAPRRAQTLHHDTDTACKTRVVRRHKNPTEAELVEGRVVRFFLGNDVCISKAELATKVDASQRTLERAIQLLRRKPRVPLLYDGRGRCFHLGERTFGEIDDYTLGDLAELGLLPRDWEDRIDLALQVYRRDSRSTNTSALKRRLTKLTR